MDNKTQFEKDLESLINSHSKENDSNTPDFVLAEYLKNCLEAFNNATKARDKFHNIKLGEHFQKEINL